MLMQRSTPHPEIKNTPSGGRKIYESTAWTDKRAYSDDNNKKSRGTCHLNDMLRLQGEQEQVLVQAMP
jgi:hypothetical protein